MDDAVFDHVKSRGLKVVKWVLEQELVGMLYVYVVAPPRLEVERPRPLTFPLV
jgi:hypothetical protein